MDGASHPCSVLRQIQAFKGGVEGRAGGNILAVGGVACNSFLFSTYNISCQPAPTEQVLVTSPQTTPCKYICKCDCTCPEGPQTHSLVEVHLQTDHQSKVQYCPPTGKGRGRRRVTLMVGCSYTWEGCGFGMGVALGGVWLYLRTKVDVFGQRAVREGILKVV